MPRNALIGLSAIALLSAALSFYLSSDDSSRYLVFSTWGTPGEIASFRRLIDHYNETRHPKHPVRLSHSEQYQYTERLLVQAAALGAPDVMHLDRNDIPLFVRRGLLEDLTPAIRRDTGFDAGVFLPGLSSGCIAGGRWYALPHNFSTIVLYYNRDHFDAAGMPYPDSTWTWETLLGAASKLTRLDKDSNVVRYGCMMQIAFATLLAQNGGRVLDDALDSCVIASPECEGALRFAVDLSEKYHVSWSMLAQNLQWDDMFTGGRLSMIANGRWAAVSYVRAMGDSAVDAAPLPRGKLRRGAAAVHVMAVSSQSGKKDEAWEFLKYLESGEGEMMVNEQGAAIPAVRSIVASPGFLRHRLTPAMNNAVFVDELRHSTVWPFEQGPYLSTYTLQSQFELAVRRVLLHEAAPMQSLKMMEAVINRDIAAGRRVPVPEPFLGSTLFYLCVLIPPAVLLLVRRKH